MSETDDPWRQAPERSATRRQENPEDWARQALERVATAAIVEHRRSRRWGIFFKFLFFIGLGAVLFVVWPTDWEASVDGEHTAIVKLEGVILDGTEASASEINLGLRAAFEHERTRGVILSINSPGGSPVQAGLIYDELLRLRSTHPDTKVFAVVADMCASGGYYVAAAADEIYANRASIIGSIGVRADGFGFSEALEKLGIERRLYTAGDHKAFLDPFSPPRTDEVAHLRVLLNAIHQQFIDAVRGGRGDRLLDSEEVFSGLVWTGERSVELGLVDGFDTVDGVAKNRIGAAKLVDFTPKQGLLRRFALEMESVLLRVVGQLGVLGL